jgi:hypothetical protein
MAGEGNHFGSSRQGASGMEVPADVAATFRFIEDQFAVGQNPSSGEEPKIMVANLYDATRNIWGNTRIPIVLRIQGHVANQVVYAVRPVGGTDVISSETGEPVQWVELGGGGGLPPGQGKGKALFLIDNLTPGTPAWDQWRF